MRYYLVNKKTNEELVFDLIQSAWVAPDIMEFEYCMLKDYEQIDRKKVYICKMAGRYFSSYDRVKWKKIPRQEIPRHFVNVDQEFYLHRGFRPSGLDAEGGSGLKSQMPGKITEVYVKEGQKVEKGEPLLILEAMKMENIIKAVEVGVVKKINVNAGDTVDKGVLLIDFENNEEG